jgi:hypothetical protein
MKQNLYQLLMMVMLMCGSLFVSSYNMTAPEDLSPQKAFLEKFYQGLDNDLLDYNLVKQNVTPKALQFLKDSYDYDCEGECLATWVFLYEAGGDTGAIQERQIEMVEANTYDVKCVYEGYEYVVRLTLVAEGNTYKIDTIKTISSQYF